jgi:uncharacterized protein YdiU (UPF0061 family)
MSDTLNKVRWRLDHSYTSLPPDFFSAVAPTPVAQPRMLTFNSALAETLGIGTPAALDELSTQLSGNALPEGAYPLAQAYAGHQFGHFTMLGDGRAILLGEQTSPDGQRWDIQLKGAGPTPYSRRGDGRATMSAMLREYLMSEAMFYLGVPTTRSLAVVGTGQAVYREQVQPGAVLTRVAASHIRVGTFEFAREFLPESDLKALLQYTIQRHYPELEKSEHPAADFLQQVLFRQVDLLVHWMRIGFIHGVMNTDNMSIAGETIDYGPCAFMNAYHPHTVFSSIDAQGRYAFARQPALAQWNLAVLAGALMPLLAPEEEKAVEIARNIIEGFNDLYARQWQRMMCGKLGIITPAEGDAALIQEFLQWMAQQSADYTNTFLMLSAVLPLSPEYEADAAFQNWRAKWEQRIESQVGGREAAIHRMRQHNPVFIARNHQVEAALKAATQGDFTLFDTLLQVLRRPYEVQNEYAYLMEAPLGGDVGYKTFCGT